MSPETIKVVRLDGSVDEFVRRPLPPTDRTPMPFRHNGLDYTIRGNIIYDHEGHVVCGKARGERWSVKAKRHAFLSDITQIASEKVRD